MVQNLAPHLMIQRSAACQCAGSLFCGLSGMLELLPLVFPTTSVHLSRVNAFQNFKFTAGRQKIASYSNLFYSIFLYPHLQAGAVGLAELTALDMQSASSAKLIQCLTLIPNSSGSDQEDRSNVNSVLSIKTSRPILIYPETHGGLYQMNLILLLFSITPKAPGHFGTRPASSFITSSEASKELRPFCDYQSPSQIYSVEQEHAFWAEDHITLIRKMVTQIPSKLYIKMICLTHFPLSYQPLIHPHGFLLKYSSASVGGVGIISIQLFDCPNI